MAEFHEASFPLAIALGAKGGPERKTEIVTLGSGFEERNARWADSRRRYDAGSGLRTLDDIHAVLAFFEERRGRLHGFRFRDRADCRSGPPRAAPTAGDQSLGTGDGATSAFALVKRYGSGATAYARRIAKPVAGSVLVAVDGVPAGEGSVWTLDPAAGTVIFLPGHVPGAGAAVTAGFLFDVPVRFDADRLVVSLTAFEAGEIPSVPLVEILL